MSYINKSTHTLLLLCLMAISLNAQTKIDLLKDINTVGASEPTWLTPGGQHLFFLADDGLHDQDLWVTSGEGGSTHLVKNMIGFFDTPLGIWAIGEKSLIMIEKDELLTELWVSDGTETGTILLSQMGLPGFLNPPAVVTFGNQALITTAEQIWVSDGTQSGTQNISHWIPGTAWTAGQPASAGDRAFFVVNYGPDSNAVWVTNGTLEGTQVVKNLYGFPNVNVKNFHFFQGEMYFSANAADETNVEIWASDGKPSGTRIVKTLNDSVGYLQEFTTVGTKFFFKFVPLAGPNPVLWQSDGSPDGTNRTDILPKEVFLSYGGLFRGFNDLLVLDAYSNGNSQLWATDGTTTNTVLLANIGLSGGVSSSALLNQKLYFFIEKSSPNRRELWVTNGSAADTKLVSELSIKNNYSAELVTFKDHLYFSGYDPLHEQELWTSDGTASGTALFADIRKSGDANPYYLFQSGKKLFFSAFNSLYQRELWVTEGHESNTKLVQDIALNASSNPRGFTELKEKIIFAASNSSSGEELWISDGSPAGTNRLADIFPGASSSRPSFLTNFKDKVYFSAFSTQRGNEVWSTDGTSAGTRLLKDIVAGSMSSYPRNFMELNDKLYFNAKGGELWTTDGTDAGTVRLLSLSPLTTESTVYQRTKVLNGKMYMWVNNSNTGFEPWVSDGSANGTYLLKDIIPGSPSSYPANLLSFNGKVWFSTEDNFLADRPNLWVTDGTAAGTQLFTTPDFPLGFAGAQNMQLYGGNLYFSTPGGKIWATDGTAGNTKLVVDLQLHERFPVFFMREYGGWLWFVAFEAPKGFYLWRTDGTASGTEKVEPGFATADNPLGIGYPDEALVYNGALYFSAKFDDQGAELYKLTFINNIPVIEKALSPIQISPNPASTQIQISNNGPDTGIWMLYNTTGQLVLQTSINATSQHRITIDHLPNGIYTWKWEGLKYPVGGLIQVVK